MRRVVVVLVLLVLTTPASAQQRLSSVAEAARGALARGEVGALLRSGDRILLQLPNAQPSAPVGLAQAEAALRSLLGRGEEHQVVVVGYRETGGGRGYVELRREYRPMGGAAPRSQQVLLGYRRTERGWVLEEIRVF
jgi:hypothetical protein